MRFVWRVDPHEDGLFPRFVCCAHTGCPYYQDDDDDDDDDEADEDEAEEGEEVPAELLQMLQGLQAQKAHLEAELKKQMDLEADEQQQLDDQRAMMKDMERQMHGMRGSVPAASQQAAQNAQAAYMSGVDRMQVAHPSLPSDGHSPLKTAACRYLTQVPW